MQTLIDFIDNRENLKGILCIAGALFLIAVWCLVCELRDAYMMKRWGKAEKLRRKLENVVE